MFKISNMRACSLYAILLLTFLSSLHLQGMDTVDNDYMVKKLFKIRGTDIPVRDSRNLTPYDRAIQKPDMPSDVEIAHLLRKF